MIILSVEQVMQNALQTHKLQNVKKGDMLTGRQDTQSLSFVALATVDCWFNDSPPPDCTMVKTFLNDAAPPVLGLVLFIKEIWNLDIRKKNL